MTNDLPPSDPDRPAEGEYQAILVMDDEEIGVPSDIMSAVSRPFKRLRRDLPDYSSVRRFSASPS